MFFADQAADFTSFQGFNTALDSVVLLQRGWWVGTKNNRGATNAVLCERRRYILDDSKRFGHGPNQPSETGSILLREKALKRPSLSLRQLSELTQPKERSEWKGEIISEEVRGR
jgi:hypothetical protein